MLFATIHLVILLFKFGRLRYHALLSLVVEERLGVHTRDLFELKFGNRGLESLVHARMVLAVCANFVSSIQHVEILIGLAQVFIFTVFLLILILPNVDLISHICLIQEILELCVVLLDVLQVHLQLRELAVLLALAGVHLGGRYFLQPLLLRVDPLQLSHMRQVVDPPVPIMHLVLSLLIDLTLVFSDQGLSAVPRCIWFSGPLSIERCHNVTFYF